MRILQDALESVLREELSPHKLGALVIKEKLEALGIRTTDEQLVQIEEKLHSGDLDTMILSFDDEQIGADAPIAREAIEQSYTLDLSDSGAEIGELVEQVNRELSDRMPDLVDQASEPILEELRYTASGMLKARRRGRREFEARLAAAWHEPLDLLEMFLVICLEAGDDFNQGFRPKAAEEDNYVFEVLTRLHARACQIASEVLVLLESGHADGAHARWRALHEVAVVSLLVASAGNEVAERYLLYEAIQSWKAAKEYQKYYQRLGYEPIPQEELAELESACDHLVDRFGTAYKKGDYGWATPAIKDRPTFRKIEQAVGLDHLRPYYQMACYNVHADPKGAFFRLGLYPTDKEVLLAGPSNVGLSDPGQGTAISLLQATTALLLTEPSLDSLVICNILIQLSDEIGREFFKAQKTLEEEV